MKSFAKEFKEFIMRGNVLDLAVGVIIGGAFTAIVTSLNADIITPLLGIIGGNDFSSLTVKLGSGPTAPILTYGNFIMAIINFLITAFVVFLFIKFVNKFNRKKEVVEEVTTKICPYCKSEISKDATRCPNCTSEL